MYGDDDLFWLFLAGLVGKIDIMPLVALLATSNDLSLSHALSFRFIQKMKPKILK